MPGKRREPRAYLRLYAIYLLAVSAAAAVVLPILHSFGLLNFGVSISWLVILVCASLIFNTINQTCIPSLNLLGSPGSFVALTIATLTASLVCAVTLALLFQASAQYWLFGILLGQTLFAAVGTRVLFNKLCEKRALGLFEKLGFQKLHVLAGFAWPVALAAGFGWAQSQGYRFVLDSQLGMEKLGLFAAGYTISAGVIAAFEGVLTTYFQPRLYRDVNKDHPDEQWRAWRRYASSIIPSLILTVVLITMLSQELTLILLGERFQGAAEFVVWGALAEAARVLTGVYSLAAHVHMRTRSLIVPTAVGAALSIFLCMLLIPLYGTAGAGIALVLAGFSVVILLNLLIIRRAIGGLPLLALGKTLLHAAVLVLVILGLRALFVANNWSMAVIIILLTGVIYLALVYSLLQQYFYKLSES